MDKGAENYLRFIGGNDEGIADLVREYRDGLIFYLNGFVCNLNVAEDLAEDTFFKLMIKKPKYKAKCSFKTWLYTIGRHIAIDYLRRESRFTHNPIDSFGELSQESDELERIYADERRAELHRAIQGLKKEYREVLYLRCFDDFTNEQTATILKKDKRQIETLVYRAKKALKAKLQEADFIYEEL